MHRFGECLIYSAPLLFVLSVGCSSDDLTVTVTDGGSTGTGGTLDATAAGTTMVTIPVGATGVVWAGTRRIRPS